jgi:hypothetical protein
MKFISPPCVARRLSLFDCLVGGITLTLSVGALATAPYLTAAKPITDAQGRISVIVDFFDDALLS